MKRSQSLWRWCQTAWGAAGGWLAVGGIALAKEAEAAEEGSGGAGWLISYLLVALGIALGMLVLLRPTRRRERARPEQYGD